MNGGEGNTRGLPGGRLTQQDRERITAGLATGLSYAEIARRADRAPLRRRRERRRELGTREERASGRKEPARNVGGRPDRAHAERT
ncbi:helix-turn-helix domain-containing protein [Streptomyces vietnamensis]|uniref:helix-turn-helix domain-containing protein n=1 Tax=Streptomyces vietnamensis TaxID=362257 RepID=UPI003CCBF0A1